MKGEIQGIEDKIEEIENEIRRDIEKLDKYSKEQSTMKTAAEINKIQHQLEEKKQKVEHLRRKEERLGRKEEQLRSEVELLRKEKLIFLRSKDEKQIKEKLPKEIGMS